jgi:hypothetical protein
LRGAFLPDFGFWQWPLWQQSFFTPGTMKNCGQETQPPHRRVAMVSPQRSEVRKERNTASFIMLFIGGQNVRGDCEAAWLAWLAWLGLGSDHFALALL